MQRNLFSPFGDDTGTQRDLFPGHFEQLREQCGECNAPLIRSVNGWHVCPYGCGGLVPPEDGEGSGQWFEETE